MLISIVGIDGSGKSTQVELLKSNLPNVKTIKARPDNRAIVENLECDNNEIYMEVLSIAMALDIIKTYNLHMKEAHKYDYIIWDRYTYCLQSYLLAQNFDCKVANQILKNIKRPDLIIWLKLDPEIADVRIGLRGNRKKLEKVEFMALVQDQYEQILKNEKNVVAISCDDMSSEELQQKIIDYINYYKKGE